MPTFEYAARDKTGREVTGTQEASTKEAVFEQLKQKGLVASSVEERKAKAVVKKKTGGRLFGGKMATGTPHLEQMVEQIATGYYNDKLEELKKMPEEELKKLYSDRQQEPHQADEYWKPESQEGL